DNREGAAPAEPLGAPRASSRAVHAVASWKAHKKARVPTPTQTPAIIASSAHFSVLTSSAVCSVYQRVSSASFGGIGSAASAPEGVCSGPSPVIRHPSRLFNRTVFRRRLLAASPHCRVRLCQRF